MVRQMHQKDSSLEIRGMITGLWERGMPINDIANEVNLSVSK